MEISAITPAYIPTSASQHSKTVSVQNLYDGTHRVKEIHYVTTVYNNKGMISSTQNSWTVSYLV